MWSPDGRELFYRNGDAVMAVKVETDPAFKPGKPEVLFQGKYVPQLTNGTTWAIGRDGRFLMMKAVESTGKAPAAESPRKIHVVLNWLEELKQRVPTSNQEDGNRDYETSADDSMPEMLDAKSAGESILRILRTASQLAFPDAHDGSSCSGSSEGWRKRRMSPGSSHPTRSPQEDSLPERSLPTATASSDCLAAAEWAKSIAPTI